MIIWGSKGRTTEIARGQFYCPRCQTLRPYVHKQLGRYFTLYFIPIFKTSTAAEYIECQFCATPFETSILEYDGAGSPELQGLLEGIGGLIEKGLPLNAVYAKLLEEGASKESANIIISMATKGSMKVCKKCELIYAGSLRFCCNCGGALEVL